MLVVVKILVIVDGVILFILIVNFLVVEILFNVNVVINLIFFWLDVGSVILLLVKLINVLFLFFVFLND